jgi:DNA repair exonuclease SbcCD ATPase subunit
MLKSLTLENFQAHKSTSLEFDPHITAIVGTTDSGKTSILRALYWVLQNKPSGIQMVSFWNRKKDGSPKGTTSASLLVDDHTITRVRSNERNGYDWDTKELSAIGREVPEEITKYLNLSDINIARQFDQHFLLSESAGEVARRLNELVRLDIIDETLSKAEKAKREAKKAGDEADSAISIYQKKLDALSWLDQAEGPLEQLEKTEGDVKKAKDASTRLSTAREGLQAYETTLKVVKHILEAGRAPIEQISDILVNQRVLKQQIDNLLSIKGGLRGASVQIDAYALVRPAKRVLELFEEVIQEQEGFKGKKEALQGIRGALMKVDKDIKNLYIEVEEWKGQFPKVCPSCGKPLEESHEKACNDSEN